MPPLFLGATETDSSMSGHGGPRVGAGRPKVTLDELVVGRRFDSRNRRHRRALLEDPLTLPPATDRLDFLHRHAAAYGRSTDRGSRATLAQAFAAVVQMGDYPWE